MSNGEEEIDEHLFKQNILMEKVALFCCSLLPNYLHCKLQTEPRSLSIKRFSRFPIRTLSFGGLLQMGRSLSTENSIQRTHSFLSLQTRNWIPETF